MADSEKNAGDGDENDSGPVMEEDAENDAQPSQDEPDKCVRCKIEIENEENFVLQCDLCLKYTHAMKCLKYSKATFNMLARCKEVKWFCPGKCFDEADIKYKVLHKVLERQDQLELKNAQLEKEQLEMKQSMAEAIKSELKNMFEETDDSVYPTQQDGVGDISIGPGDSVDPTRIARLENKMREEQLAQRREELRLETQKQKERFDEEMDKLQKLKGK